MKILQGLNWNKLKQRSYVKWINYSHSESNPFMPSYQVIDVRFSFAVLFRLCVAMSPHMHTDRD